MSISLQWAYWAAKAAYCLSFRGPSAKQMLDRFPRYQASAEKYPRQAAHATHTGLQLLAHQVNQKRLARGLSSYRATISAPFANFVIEASIRSVLEHAGEIIRAMLRISPTAEAAEP